MKASDILAFNDLRTSVVEVKEWKCSLKVRELDLEEGLSLFSSVDEDMTISAEDVARVVAWCVIDDDGERLFSDEDIPALTKKNRKPLMQLYTAITSLSGDDAEKN